MNTRVIVSAVIEKDDQILFGKKKTNAGPYPNTWHLIGGGLNEGESLEDAIQREIREEANIEVDIVESLGFDEDIEPNKHGEPTHYVFLVFKAVYLSGQITANDDIVELSWIHKSELATIPLNKPSIKLFQKMRYL